MCLAFLSVEQILGARYCVTKECVFDTHELARISSCKPDATVRQGTALFAGSETVSNGLRAFCDPLDLECVHVLHHSLELNSPFLLLTRWCLEAMNGILDASFDVTCSSGPVVFVRQ